eukprot:GFYU01007760.1.p1 GENE.GFYU01007760.1~~GFYU01007760.1.p1  ORF type:complete len:310 (+),score=51.63 GFYU01007760.1:85-930(+)
MSGEDDIEFLKAEVARLRKADLLRVSEMSKIQAALEHEKVLNRQLQEQVRSARSGSVEPLNELEQEQEFVVNKLQKQISDLSTEKSTLTEKLENAGSVEKQLEEEKEKNAKLTKENGDMKTEIWLLKQKIEFEKQKGRQIQSQMANLEGELEVESEKYFNEFSSPKNSPRSTPGSGGGMTLNVRSLARRTPTGSPAVSPRLVSMAQVSGVSPRNVGGLTATTLGVSTHLTPGSIPSPALSPGFSPSAVHEHVLSLQDPSTNPAPASVSPRLGGPSTGYEGV